jgi:uridine kinase
MKTALPGSEELLEKVLAHLGPKWLPRLIGIDGDDGVGKSSLASWLAWQLGAPTVHLDLYLIRDSNPVRWRTEDLQRVVTTRVDQQGPLIIEGMMLLEALAGIGRKVDFLVYVHGPGTRSLSKMLAEYRARHQPERLASCRLQGFTE